MYLAVVVTSLLNYSKLAGQSCLVYKFGDVADGPRVEYNPVVSYPSLDLIQFVK